MTVDHLLWGAPELDRGVATLARLTGSTAAPGGVHPGRGTRNALLSTGDAYVEVIAPDPAQGRVGLGRVLADLDEPRLVGWAARADDAAMVTARALHVGLTPVAVPMRRSTADGDELGWTVVTLGGHDLGGVVPFAIDWGASPHPSATAPPGPELVSFAVSSPRADEVQAVIDRLGLDEGVEVRDGPEPELRAVLACAGGLVELAGAPLPTLGPGDAPDR